MHKKTPSFIIITILCLALSLCGLFADPVKAQDFSGETKIFFFRATNAASDMILIESGGRYGLIDTSFRSEPTITSDGKTYELNHDNLYNSKSNGLKNAKYMIDILGISHLDFIIGTHSHSDHIGGVPEIAGLEYKDTKLVDSDTVYIYKPYRSVNDKTNNELWLNPVFYKEALKGMKSAGARPVDISNRYSVSSTLQKSINYNTVVKELNDNANIADACYIQGSKSDWYDDHITFRFGSAKISLYNLFTTPTRFDENVNSICALIYANGKYVVSNSDINDDNQAAQKIARAIHSELNGARVSVLKASHHGLDRRSNTKEEADLYRPMHVFQTSPSNSHSDSFTNFIHYCTEKFKTKFYFNSDFDKAAVVALGKNGVSIRKLDSSGSESVLSPDSDPMSHAEKKTGWNSWDSEITADGLFAGQQNLWRYFYNGSPVINDWKKIKGSWYYFDTDGFMMTKWLRKDNTSYYLGENGVMRKGLQQIDGDYYYFGTNGAMRTGLQQIDGKHYYFGKDGIRQTGWQVIDGKKYYFDTKGIMQTGWKVIEKKYYYFGDDGIMQTGIRKIGDKNYYLGKDGTRQTGWQLVNGKYYYLSENGVMKTGWGLINDKYYYLGENGSMKTGWQLVNGKYYYLAESGVMRTGWRLINGKYYYLAESGVMRTGWRLINGKYYYLAENGVMKTGWQFINGKYYYLKDNGVMKTGWLHYNDHYYFLKDSGAMATGWLKLNESWYYFKENGVMVTGTKKINGKYYFFSKSGILYQT